jgi:hypothetical protein
MKTQYLKPAAADRNAVQAQAAHDYKIECITKAHQVAEMLRGDLLQAGKRCNAIESLALMPLIAQASALCNGLAALEFALRDTE